MPETDRSTASDTRGTPLGIISLMDYPLPTPDDVEQDLRSLMRDLRQSGNVRLESLAALPSIRFWQPPANTRPFANDSERLACAIEQLVIDAIARQPYEDDRSDLGQFFYFKEPGRSLTNRRDAVAERMKKSSDAVRMADERRLLHTLAQDVYRQELRWCIAQLESDRPVVQTPMGIDWWTYVEIDWAFHVEDDDPTMGIWDLRHVLKFNIPVDQPVVVVNIKWTVIPPTESQVEVLSGSEADDKSARHKLLSIRPAISSPGADTAYIWDLGDPVRSGDEVELRWRERIPDTAQKGQPYLGVSTALKPDLRLIRLRADVPDSLTVHPRIEEFIEYPSTPHSSYASLSVKRIKMEPIARDDKGYFVHMPSQIITGHRYELWWGERRHSV